MSLKYFIENLSPSLIFLSEPMIFQCDVASIVKFLPYPHFHLNSEDLYDESLPLERGKPKGGTMILWPPSLDPFITVMPTTISSILPVKVRMPGCVVSFHFCIYFPTAGKDDAFVEILSVLASYIEDLQEQHGDCPIFIRGDANASSKNPTRAPIFKQFLSQHDLQRVQITHNTYHHFVGNGEFDSDLDVVIFSKLPSVSESIDDVICKLKNPLISSHHDLVVSSFSLPQFTPLPPSLKNIIAPRIPNGRQKVLWSQEGVNLYQERLGMGLVELRQRWQGAASSPSLMSILLSSTYSLMQATAASTNKVIDLGKIRAQKVTKSPLISRLQRILLRAQRNLESISSSPSVTPAKVSAAKAALNSAREELTQATRAQTRQQSLERDSKLATSNFQSLFKSIKSSRSASGSKISSIRVGDQVYQGDSVPDGFFHSMSNLKHPDMGPIYSSPHFQSTMSDFKNIVKICESGARIPPIPPEVSLDILFSVRADVNDFYSITANHFINAGQTGVDHHHFILSSIIDNVNLSSIDELNTAWACILYKGHQKDKESDRSYRTISTCPFIAKCADIYIGRLYSGRWNSVQAETQFQGEGSSHELSALLLTEAIQHSTLVNKKPVYALFLDAKSAFDKVVIQSAIRAAYQAGTKDQGLLYLLNRLSHRRTFPEWDKVLMGPIADLLGLEQGNVYSDKIYKLCNNNQLSTAQKSRLGVDCDAAVVSAIGQADDTVLLSDCIFKLYGLVHLAEEYCSTFHVELVPEKTKLLGFSPARNTHSVFFSEIVNPISIQGTKINFDTLAEHVGVIRTPNNGNMSHIIARISAHRRAVQSVLHCGMARSHRGNINAALRLEKIYGAPVLLSGCASLVLSTAEMSTLNSHYRTVTRQILRLPKTTPECFVMLASGSLPAIALLHLRMLSLLGMIGRLGREGILFRIGCNSLTSAANSRSWFINARHVTQQYGLTDPLLVIQHPDSRYKWKSACRKKVTEWWETYYRGQAMMLDSLEFFKPQWFSLSKPHLIISAPGSPYEVGRAATVLLMLSGRYITDHRSRRWDKSNPEGLCRLCPAPAPVGDLAHQLLFCNALEPARTKAVLHWGRFSAERPYLRPLLSHYSLGTVVDALAFLLDPCSCPMVISAAQEMKNQAIFNECLYLCRVWCHGNHKLRLKLLRNRALI